MAANSGQEPTSSVIVVSYNSQTYLEDCLASVTREIGSNDEIIVVDNASTDGGTQVIATGYPSVRLIASDSNVGFAAACNLGARSASGSYLVFLNPDTIVCPGWLSELVGVFAVDVSVGLATSKALLMAEPEKIQACGLDIHCTGLSFARGFGEASADYAAPETVSSVFGASFAIRAELWRQLGGFDETFFMYYEETDLAWRAQLLGYRCVFAPASVIYHAHSNAPSAGRLYYSSRNRHLLLLKNWRWPTLVLLLPALVLAELQDWSYLLLVAGRRGVSIKISGYRWLLGNLRQILRTRRVVQASRRTADRQILQRRVARLTRRELAIGRAGQWVIQAANVLFDGNYRACSCLLRLLRL